MPRIWTIGYERLLPAELVAERRADGRPRDRVRAPQGARHAAGPALTLQGRPHRRGGAAFRAHVERTAAHELDALAAELDRGTRTVLLCLEAEPAACHRCGLTDALRERRPRLEIVDL